MRLLARSGTAELRLISCGCGADGSARKLFKSRGRKISKFVTGLMRQPGRGFFGPDALRRFVPEFLRNLAKHRMIVGSLVVAYRAPVARLGNDGSLGIPRNNLTIDSLGVRPFHLLEREPSQSHFELSLKLIFRQI